MRVLVIGNSGSGKSTLARTLAAEHGLAHLDLDTLAWQPTEPPQRLPLDVAAAELVQFTGEHAGAPRARGAVRGLCRPEAAARGRGGLS